MKEKIELIIPESLKDLTLKQYQEYLQKTRGIDSELLLRQNLMTVFTGVKFKDINNIPHNDFVSITNSISNIIDNEHAELIPTFTFKGVEYGFIPDLDSISLGEFIDLDTYIGNWDNMHIAMSVLYRPIRNKKGSKYTIQPYKAKVNEDFKELTLDIVLGAMVFFYRLSRELLQILKASLVKLLATNKQKVLEILTKASMLNGDGKSLSTPLVEEIFLTLIKSQRQTYIPASTIFHI